MRSHDPPPPPTHQAVMSEVYLGVVQRMENLENMRSHDPAPSTPQIHFTNHSLMGGGGGGCRHMAHTEEMYCLLPGSGSDEKKYKQGMARINTYTSILTL